MYFNDKYIYLSLKTLSCRNVTERHKMFYRI